jgi:hypothetical protein
MSPPTGLGGERRGGRCSGDRDGSLWEVSMAEVLLIVVFFVHHFTDSRLLLVVIVQEVEVIVVGKVKLGGVMVLVFVIIMMALISSLDIVIGILTGFIFGTGTLPWTN